VTVPPRGAGRRPADRRPGTPGADDPTIAFPAVGPVPDDVPTDSVERVPPGTDRAGRDSAQGPVDEPEEAAARERTMPTLMEQMGGVSGIVYSTVPVAVFVVVNLLTELRPALVAAIAVGLLIAVVRVVRREPLQPAVSGLVGVAVCAFIANRSGQARDFYLPGLLYSAGLGLACLVSVLVRWPLAGVIWHGINGEGQGWRRDPRLLRAYTLATVLWTVVFAARLVVQGWLYNVDEADWLGVARLLMGYPLLGLALLGTVLAVRRAHRQPAPGEA
jgi:hypothetical protein